MGKKWLAVPDDGNVGAVSGQKKSEKQQVCFDKFVFNDVHVRPPLGIEHDGHGAKRGTGV